MKKTLKTLLWVGMLAALFRSLLEPVNRLEYEPKQDGGETAAEPERVITQPQSAPEKTVSQSGLRSMEWFAGPDPEETLKPLESMEPLEVPEALKFWE